LADRFVQFSGSEAVRIRDGGDDQAAFSLDRDPEIDVFVLDDLLPLGVEAGVEHGVGPERRDDEPRDIGDEAGPATLARGFPQLRFPLHVYPEMMLSVHEALPPLVAEAGFDNG